MQHRMHERPSLLASGMTPLYGKSVLASKRRRAYNNSMRRSPSILSPENDASTLYYTSPCAHTRAYRHPSCRHETHRHSIVIIYHYARGKTRSINPRRVQPRYHWFMHCDVGTAIKGDLSRACLLPPHGIRNQPSRARISPESQWKKMSTFHFVHDPSGFEISGAIRSSYTKQHPVTNNPVSV